MYISSFDRKEDGTQYTIGLSFDEDEYETPYYIDLNVAHVTDSGNEIGGLSNSEDSSKTYTFSGNDDARYFYIENKLDIAQTFKQKMLILHYLQQLLMEVRGLIRNYG